MIKTTIKFTVANWWHILMKAWNWIQNNLTLIKYLLCFKKVFRRLKIYHRVVMHVRKSHHGMIYIYIYI